MSNEYISEYTMDEVKNHNTAESLWVVLNDKVYNVTSFLKAHPGGEKPLLKYAGTDATVKFNSVKAHKESPTIPSFMESMCIGVLKK